MATNVWIGAQTARAKVVTVTVSSATNAQTFTLTTGTGKSISYTASGDTTTTIAAALLVLVAAMVASEGDWAELTFSTNTANAFTVTGPADGAPFTLTAGGTGTMTASQTTAPLSPHDLNDAANWSLGAVPVDTDDLVWENSGVSVLYNLSALAAVVPNSATRRKTFPGRIGLPDYGPGGYREFRAKDLSLKCAAIYWEQTGRDFAQQFRLLNVDAGGATTLTVVGDGTVPEVGAEVLEARGMPAASVVNCAGGSVAVAPLAGQAATVLTLLAVGSTVRVGPSATLSGTVNLKDCQALVKASWTTSLTADGRSAVEVAGAAAGKVVIQGGAVTWKSTGTPGTNSIVGSGATLDLSQAPAALGFAGTLALYAGATLDDAAGRGGNYSVTLTACTLAEVTWVTSNSRTLAIS